MSSTVNELEETITAETLTIREYSMLRDAVFQRSADARTEREEDRWLSLDAKLQRLSQRLERERCSCGHARKSHRTATEEASTCRICHCTHFTAEQNQERSNVREPRTASPI